MRYVRDVHRLTRMMVLSKAPASLRAMAPPAQRLCDDMRLRVHPLKAIICGSPSNRHPNITVGDLGGSAGWVVHCVEVALLANANTTKPLRRRNGLVVKHNANKSLSIMLTSPLEGPVEC